MSKYESLTTYLNLCKNGRVRLSFSELEEILGFTLPLSARKYKAWWNNKDKSHSHSKSWGSAGYRVSDVVLETYVVFEKEV